jgi:acyl-CoA synthetase (AMP-forming)/AMP-acid ligase II
VNVWDFLTSAAANYPHHEALRQGPRVHTYAEARQLATQLAATLRERGVQRGDRIGCLMHNHIDHYLAYFAARRHRRDPGLAEHAPRHRRATEHPCAQ